MSGCYLLCGREAFDPLTPRSFILSTLALLSVVLTGCNELRGPVWSPDGRRVLFTTYLPVAAGGFDTSLYLLEADEEAAQPHLVAKGASFPFWKSDSTTAFFAGDRDAQGFYTKVFKYTVGPDPAQPVITNIRLSGLQFSSDGSVALLAMGREARIGGACTLELWTLNDNKRTQLTQLGEVFSPALTENGRAVAYTQKAADSLPLLLVCDLNGDQPRAVFPTEDNNEPGATSYCIHAFPDNDRFLFYAPGGGNVWTIKRDGTNIKKFPLPEGRSSPLMISIAEDGSSATVTLALGSAESLQFEVHKLDFNAKRFTRIDGPSPELLGGHALDPRAVRRKGPARYAWFSSSGMSLGEPGKARYFPTSARQCVAACDVFLSQNDPEKAVATILKARDYPPPIEDPGMIDRAEARAYLAAKKFERAADAFERASLLFPIGPEGLQLIYPQNLSLPRPAAGDLAARVKEMEGLIRQLPDNRLLPLLKQALEARIQGKQKQALEVYKQAIPICPDEARVGGVRFLEAMTLFEFGDLPQAAERWESAARSADFPQAHIAAALASVAFSLDGRPEVVQRAAGPLALAPVKASAWSQELGQLSTHMRGVAFRERTEHTEFKSGDGAVSAWIERGVSFVPFASLKPVRTLERDGKYTLRRVGVKRVFNTAIGIGAEAVFRIPQAITQPKFSLNNKMLAFTVSGEVFPLPDTYCDLFIIDTQGKIIFGNASAAATGQVRGRRILRELEWGENQLTIKGSEVDMFGGETAFTHSLPIEMPQGK